MSEPSKVFWTLLGTWCVYQLIQALRCAYYLMFEPWVVEQDDEE